MVNQLPPAVVPQLLTALGELLPATPHVEYLLTWAKALCTRHGAAVQAAAGAALPALRSLQKALTRLHEDLAATCERNLYELEYLATAGQALGATQADDAGEQQAAVQQQGGRQLNGGGGAVAEESREESEEEGGSEDEEMSD